MNKIEGYVYILGDDINMDDIIPSHVLIIRDSNEMAKYTLQHIDPNFVEKVKKHCILVAGENFGTGSSREEAVHVFRILGVNTVIAKSFARIYFRNLINLGIPGIQLLWDKDMFNYGDYVEITLNQGEILNKTKNLKIKFEKLPAFLTKILEDGGILNQLVKKL